MKILHLVLIVIQLPLALFTRDQNRIAYLLYLVGWNASSSDISSNSRERVRARHGSYKETRADTTHYEYSLLLEQ